MAKVTKLRDELSYSELQLRFRKEKFQLRLVATWKKWYSSHENRPTTASYEVPMMQDLNMSHIEVLSFDSGGKTEGRNGLEVTWLVTQFLLSLSSLPVDAPAEQLFLRRRLDSS